MTTKILIVFIKGEIVLTTTSLTTKTLTTKTLTTETLTTETPRTKTTPLPVLTNDHANETHAEQHALYLIEWHTIIEKLKNCAISEVVKEEFTSFKPSKNIEKIRKDLMETSEARRIVDTGSALPMNNLLSTRKALEKIDKDMVLSAGELYAVASFLRDVDRLKVYMSAKLDIAPTIATYAASADALSELKTDIIECVSEEFVLDNASTELCRLRRKIGLIEDKIKDKLDKILRSTQYKNVIQDALISQRNGRYVIPVKAAYKQQLSGSIHDKSTSGSTVFIEPEEVKRLHDELHEVKSQEEIEVYRILSELTNAIEPHKRQMGVNLEIFRHYDFIFAKGKLSKQMEAIEPAFSKSPVMKLIQARHPMLGEKAVPLDFEVGFKQKGVVITGPNTGGKTVALKTVALLSAMMRAGLHVPAEEGSVIGYFPKLLADIGDGQSIEQNLSTFSSHITHIIDILKEAGPTSLVILDEVGSGTDPTEGTGLAVAILEACYNQGATLLATTHYHEIKSFAKEHPGFINGSMAFDTVSMKPLYKLLLGVPGESNAFLIALKLGLPEHILERAHAFTYGGEANFKAQLETLWETKAQAEIIESRTVALKSHINETTEEILETFHKKDRQAGEYLNNPIIAAEREFQIGDNVKLDFMKATGIVCELENRRGELGVMVMDKKLMVNKKRMKLYIGREELYPADYDFDIIFKSKDYRKQDKLLNKGKIKVIEKR